MLIEKYIRHILAQMVSQDFQILFQGLTEANMSADSFVPFTKYIIVNANAISVQTGCDLDTGNFYEKYSLQILFVQQHAQDDDWSDFADIMETTEQIRRNFLAQITFEQTFAESNPKSVDFGNSQPWIKQFDANLSGWSLDLNIKLDIALKYCYDCCGTPEPFRICGEAPC